MLKGIQEGMKLPAIQQHVHSTYQHLYPSPYLLCSVPHRRLRCAQGHPGGHEAARKQHAVTSSTNIMRCVPPAYVPPHTQAATLC